MKRCIFPHGVYLHIKQKFSVMGWNAFFEQTEIRTILNTIEMELKEEYTSYECYPRTDQIYRAFNLTDYEKLKVVIIGQDPYHGPGQADGLAFSVPDSCKTPPSLQNILKELHLDLGVTRTKKSLDDWAQQGVLLLNTSLTVRKAQPNSHRFLGWQQFTDEVISYLSTTKDFLVFVLWGNHAQEKLPLIDKMKHAVVCSAHPSPLSAYRGFFGSAPFSKINRMLEEKSIDPINWLGAKDKFTLFD